MYYQCGGGGRRGNAKVFEHLPMLRLEHKDSTPGTQKIRSRYYVCALNARAAVRLLPVAAGSKQDTAVW